jgi:hypothetical protein
VSYESEKGSYAETVVARALAPYGQEVHRPRTTSLRERDTGDVHGLPMVVSVKNRQRMVLSEWVDELGHMVERSRWDTGVVVHKRSGRGQVNDWYVTTSFGLFLPLVEALADREFGPV